MTDGMPAPFSRTALIVVIAVALVSLAAAAALTILGRDLGGGEPSAGADTYSVSAIGHRGLVQLLERLDVPVVRSRSDSAAKAHNGLLIVAEPAVSDPAARVRLKAMIAAAPRVLVVLPKWYGRARRGASWVDEVHPLPAAEVDEVLDAIGLGEQSAVARPPAPARWNSELGQPELRAPQTITSRDIGELVGDPDAGSLVAYTETDDNALWVLTDPDVLNNAGLARPANARFTIALIDRLRAGGPVVIDEVVHGYAQPPSLLRTLFRFPLVLATLQVLVCALLAVWAAMVRFGPRRAAPPPLAPGKDFLIRNTAALLHYGGHHAEALRHYLAQSVAVVRQVVHAPALGPTALTTWLEELRRTRGGTVSLVELERDAATAVTPSRTVEIADRVHRWRMEMTHGSDHRS